MEYWPVRFFGTMDFHVDEKGYLRAFRFLEPQRRAMAGNRLYRLMAEVPAGCTMGFRTRGTTLSFSARRFPVALASGDNEALRSYGRPFDMTDAFDVSVDGNLLPPLDIRGGHKQVSWENPSAKWVSVCLHFPMAHIVTVGDVQCNAPMVPLEPQQRRILLLGDSVVQGFMAHRPALGLGALLARRLQCDVVNQGLAGYRYDPAVLEGLSGRFDAILVALGTNDWQLETDRRRWLANVERFYDVLTTSYPDTPILCMTPLWRSDINEAKVMGTFAKLQDDIVSIVQGFSTITPVDGLHASSHDPADYADGFLHPDADGFRILSDALVPVFRNVLHQGA